jgi:hypothetical protein
MDNSDLYFDEPLLKNLQKELNQENESNTQNNSEILRIKKKFPTSKDHLWYLLNLYKIITIPYTDSKSIFEQNNNELMHDVENTSMSLNLDEFLTKQTQNEKNNMLHDALMNYKILAIRTFIHYSYLYYIWSHDPEVPITTMPASSMRFNILKTLLDLRDTTVNSYYLEFITDQFASDLIFITSPPYLMRNTMPLIELENKLKDLFHNKFKDILARFLKSKK